MINSNIFNTIKKYMNYSDNTNSSNNQKTKKPRKTRRKHSKLRNKIPHLKHFKHHELIGGINEETVKPSQLNDSKDETLSDINNTVNTSITELADGHDTSLDTISNMNDVSIIPDTNNTNDSVSAINDDYESDDDVQNHNNALSVDISGKQCVNVSMAGEENIEEFLAEDGNNLAFITEDGTAFASTCIDRDTMKNTIINNTDNYYYLCRGAFQEIDGQLPLNVVANNICQTPFFNLKLIGFPAAGLVFRQNIINAINSSDDQIFVVKRFDPPLKSTSVVSVSHYRGQGDLGSNHCQPDTGDELFYITTANNDSVVPSNIKQNIDLLLSAGCIYKVGEEELPLQNANEGKPASAEIEEQLENLKNETDIPLHEVIKPERETYNATILFYETLQDIIDKVNTEIGGIFTKNNLINDI